MIKVSEGNSIVIEQPTIYVDINAEIERVVELARQKVEDEYGEKPCIFITNTTFSKNGNYHRICWQISIDCNDHERPYDHCFLHSFDTLTEIENYIKNGFKK